jgi:hypothetical protein
MQAFDESIICKAGAKFSCLNMLGHALHVLNADNSLKSKLAICLQANNKLGDSYV